MVKVPEGNWTKAGVVVAIAALLVVVFGIKFHFGSNSPTPKGSTPASTSGAPSQRAAPVASRACPSSEEFLDQQPFNGTAPTAKGLVNVDGQYFPHGLEYFLLGTTASGPAQTIYDLGGCFKTFRAVIGFDSDEEQGFSGGAQFQVVADGSVVFSDQISRGAPVCEVSASISGVSSLELNTWFLPVEPLYASWGEVRVFNNKDVYGASTFPACP